MKLLLKRRYKTRLDATDSSKWQKHKHSLSFKNERKTPDSFQNNATWFQSNSSCRYAFHKANRNPWGESAQNSWETIIHTFDTGFAKDKEV